MEFSDEKNSILLSKRAFSDVVEGVTSKIVLGETHRPPMFSTTTMENKVAHSL